MTRLLAILGLVLVQLVWTAAEAAEPAVASGVVRRFALVVGADDGGPDRTRLRYAGADAEVVSRVLDELGGVRQRDRLMLRDPSSSELAGGFRRMASMVGRARGRGDRVEFLFYYSGHSDEQGLLLEGVRIDYRKLRDLINGVPAQVRIGILDSCASGAFTRIKGGHRTAPFLAGSAASVSGHAYLTSSSEDEAAQESDRVGGSFFTHYLVTGLRGAADVNADGLVTLGEAYQFARDETLERTETTQGGAQHASYDIRLAGTGDLVMTDLRETSARLQIAADVQGRIYVRDAKGRLAAELYKPAGSGPVLLALEPGTYQITVDTGTGLSRAQVQVSEQRQGFLTTGALQPVKPEATTARGDKEGPVGVGSEYRTIPFTTGLFPPLTVNHIEREKKVVNNVAINWFLGRAAGIKGVEVSLGGSWEDEFMYGVQASIAANVVGGDVRGKQATVGVNVVGGSMRGVQTSVGANVVRGQVRGIQASVGGNFVKEDVKGLQVAVGPSMASGGLHGVQAGVGGAWAPEVKGAQLTLVNAAKNVRGAQLGLVNVATKRVHGAQVGLVNYADDADASIALVGVTRKGGVWADAWTSDVAALHIGVRFRARYTYTFLTTGFFPAGNGAAWLAGIGFGGSWKLPKKLHLEADLSCQQVFPQFRVRDDSAMLNSLRVMVHYRVARRFAVFGGPTLRTLVDFEPGDSADDIDRPGYNYSVLTRYNGSTGFRLWPGFVVGVQI